MRSEGDEGCVYEGCVCMCKVFKRWGEREGCQGERRGEAPM